MIKLPGGGPWKGRPVEPGVLAIGQTSLGEALFRGLQLKGPIPNELDRHYQLSLTALDLTRPEYLFLGREVMAWGGGPVAASPGNFGFGALRGAAGMLVVAEAVILSNPSAAPITFTIGTSAVSPSGLGYASGIPRDSRAGTSATLAGATRVAVDPAPAAPILPLPVTVGAGQTLVLELDVVLVGTAAFLVAISGTANVPIGAVFLWRERAQLPSET